MKLFFQKYGSGPPIIILHGLFGMSDNWVTFAKQLATGFEVYIPDLRNHGRSPHSGEFNYKIMQEDLLSFINEEKLEELILIGHSMGGKLSMYFALNHPELIKKLIVLDISPVTKTPSPEIMQIIEAIQTLEIDHISSRDEIKEQLTKIIEKRKIIEFILKNIRRNDDNTFGWKFNVGAIAKNLEIIAEGIESEQIFNKPSLFIGGENSDYLSGENIYDVFQYFPEAKLEVIKNAGHWLHVDAPEELLEMVIEFART